jgi:hypothetical protein
MTRDQIQYGSDQLGNLLLAEPATEREPLQLLSEWLGQVAELVGRNVGRVDRR